jgi:hypothetical protein
MLATEHTFLVSDVLPGALGNSLALKQLIIASHFKFELPTVTAGTFNHWCW